MNTSSGFPAAAASTDLGVSGYTFADLHDPERLGSLYERFCEEVEAADPAFWAKWDEYRQAPDAPRKPLDVSNLLIGMAPYVSRFLTRLFQVQPALDALRRSTTAQDNLFRFKIDFVRRRALPLLKGGAHVVSTPEDDALVARLTANASRERGVAGGGSDLELVIAQAGCALMDREKAGDTSEILKSEVESLKRWCAARLHDRAFRPWVIFRFPETLDYWHLVEVQHPEPSLPEAMLGPDWRLRLRDGFKLTDARMNPREVLSEIHYCVLCHERDKDSCSKGLLDKNGKVVINPLGIQLDGCPLDE